VCVSHVYQYLAGHFMGHGGEPVNPAIRSCAYAVSGEGVCEYPMLSFGRSLLGAPGARPCAGPAAATISRVW
jgi:hypothetical protein